MRNKLQLKFILLIAFSVALVAALMVLLILPAKGAEPEPVYDFETHTLSEVMDDFMAQHRLTEKNFAMGWYDIESGESWYFNGDDWFVAASMYKLPLAMACYDRIADGTLKATDRFSGWQLGLALDRAITQSNNDAAAAARHAISYNQMTYRNAIAVYSGFEPEDLPYGYYNENRISPEFMINTLKTLWERSEDFPELIDDLKAASPSMCFGADQGRQFEMGHKYGAFEGAVNDCAIVWADRPYLLVVFTQNAHYAERTLRELYSLTEDYAVYLHAQDEAEAVAAAAVEAQLLEEETAALEEAARLDAQRLAEEAAAAAPEPTPVPADAAPAAAAAPNTVIICIALFAAAAAAALRAFRLRKKHRGAAVCLLAAAVLCIAAAVVLLLPERGAADAPVQSVQSEEPAPDAPEPELPQAPEKTPERESALPFTPRSWTLSFAGDCTLGTLYEWRGRAASSNFLYAVGEDYGYPFSNVADFFEADDFTFVNLEGTFTESDSPVSKDYRFSAPTRYAQVLTAGSVEGVSLANNHSGDYGRDGKADTKAALDDAGILWGDAEAPIITELSGGLKLGIIPFNAVEIDLGVGDLEGYEARFRPLYDTCRAEGCTIVIAFVHWGWEYHYQPERWMKEFAHWMADLGCDMVVGSHAHVLQPQEVYDGVPIFYSLGNFCYGGHSNPKDKDSVLVQQEIISEAAGEYRLGETTLIPCSIGSTEWVNDFRPTPYEAGSQGYLRALKKLGADTP